MITNAILLLLQGVLSTLLAPLTLVNVTVDLVSSIPIIEQFLQVVVYFLPWNNLLPLILLVFSMFIFRIAWSLFNVVYHSIPFNGGS